MEGWGAGNCARPQGCLDGGDVGKMYVCVYPMHVSARIIVHCT